MSSHKFQFKNIDQPDENEILILNGLNQKYVSTSSHPFRMMDYLKHPGNLPL